MNVKIVEDSEIFKFEGNVFVTHTKPNECFSLLADVYFFDGDTFPAEIARGPRDFVESVIPRFKGDGEFSNLRIVDAYDHTVGDFAGYRSPWADIGLDLDKIPFHARRVEERYSDDD